MLTNIRFDIQMLDMSNALEFELGSNVLKINVCFGKQHYISSNCRTSRRVKRHTTHYAYRSRIQLMKRPGQHEHHWHFSRNY